MSEDLSLEALLEFLNACEAGIAAAKQLIKKGKLDLPLTPPESGSASEEPYNMERIRWSTAEGPRGTYEKTDDTNSVDYKALLQDLNTHKGKMRRGGYFLWIFEDKKTIARKKC